MAGRVMKWERLNKERKQSLSDKWQYHLSADYTDSTDNQRKFAQDMVQRCGDLGIDLAWARPRFHTKDECRKTINLAKTMLKKNGYDIYGNKVEGE